jgi:hypothetical protein
MCPTGASVRFGGGPRGSPSSRIPTERYTVPPHHAISAGMPSRDTCSCPIKSLRLAPEFHETPVIGSGAGDREARIVMRKRPVSIQSAVKPRLLFQPPSVHHIEFRSTLSRIRTETRLINHRCRRAAIVELPLRGAIRVPKLYPEPLRCLQPTLFGWRKSRPDFVVHEVQLPISSLCVFDKAHCLLRI